MDRQRCEVPAQQPVFDVDEMSGDDVRNDPGAVGKFADREARHLRVGQPAVGQGGGFRHVDVLAGPNATASPGHDNRQIVVLVSGTVTKSRTKCEERVVRQCGFVKNVVLIRSLSAAFGRRFLRPSAGLPLGLGIGAQDRAQQIADG